MNQQPRILPSVCPLDCPDTCSLSVKVLGDEIQNVRGSKANGYTGGVICKKVARSYGEFVHGAKRLRHPMKRSGAGFEPISWKEALDLVHAGFSAAIDGFGAEAVLPLNYAGPHGELAAGSMDMRFFNRLGATELDRGPLCGGVRGAAYGSLYGDAPGMPPAQAVHSDLILVWGNNVTVSNLHFTRVIKAARARGAKLVVIDPKRTKIADQADLFLQITPGTDVVLAMALAAGLEQRDALDKDFLTRWVLGSARFLQAAGQYGTAEVATLCKIETADFDTLLGWIIKARAMATSVGVGIERNRSGGAGLRAAMALNALTGQHGRLGAGIIAKSGGHAVKTSDRLQATHLRSKPARRFNILDVSDMLLDQDLATPVKAVMIYNHNPVATHPDQGKMIRALSQKDVFVVGCDVTMTDSMALCDVILPAASHFEHHEIFGAYGQNYVQRSAPVISAVGAALPNTEIFRRLAARFGFSEPEFQDSDMALMDQAFADLGQRPSEIDLESPVQAGGDMGQDAILCDALAPQTRSGKIELYSADLEARFGCALPQYKAAEAALPLTLVTPSSDKRINATFGGCAASEGPEILEMHPEDAAARGLQDRQKVMVWNALGEVTLMLQISDAVKLGVVYSPKGTWRATSDTKLTVNSLISSNSRCDLREGAAYNDTFVEVRACVP
ncbi:molybdopterin oxidoreductase family protein [Cognatishimia sp. WU-CL00825]|uniref:molybdopterin-dependent oxidoreductase n=1 Tax=Cognatishimia sp. WU-CL00825 TaxID=3127658 RepID=UPI00310B4A16